MKSSFAKFRASKAVLESALRQARRDVEVPATLHDSIMRAVDRMTTSARRVHHPFPEGEGWGKGEGDVRQPKLLRFRLAALMRGAQLARPRWLPVSALAVVVLIGAWLAAHHPAGPATSNTQSLPEISTAFTTSREIVDALPSATVGPLSNELDNVNRDLDRTAEFLLATLP
jgi:hypothetical protein